MYNKVVLVGHLSKDIEIRYVNNNTAVSSTSIATNRRYVVNGEKREEVCFIDLTFWGKTAEIANQYLRKGSKVLVDGYLKFDTWQDKNTGTTRSKHSVVVEAMKMLDSQSTQQNSNFKNSNNQNDYSYQNYTQNSSSSQNGNNSNNSSLPEIDPDELPF